jgi:hypothetical protein
MCLYFKLNDIEYLQSPNGHVSNGLRNTLPLLILFQFLRFCSLKIQGLELVCPGYAGGTDLFDTRKGSIIDFIAFVIYILTITMLTV